MHRFAISTCETVPQFNQNLRTQYIEETGYQGIRTVKTLSLKIQEATSKKCDHWEKSKTVCQINQIYQLGAFTYKRQTFPLILTLQIASRSI